MGSELARLRRKLERLERLRQVGDVLHSTLEPQAALQRIVAEAARLVDASSALAALLNPLTGLLEIHAASIPLPAAGRNLRVGEGFLGAVARAGRPLRVADFSRDSRWTTPRPGARSALAAPLEVAGEVRGVLGVDADRPDAFSAEDQRLLEELAAVAARAIHHTWLYEQLRLRARLLESLAGISRALNSTLNLEDSLAAITREACALMRGKMSSIRLLDETGAWLDLRASFGAGPAYLARARLSLTESFLGVVVRRRKASQLGNAQTSTQYQNAEMARREGVFALAAAPLISGDRALGVLSVYTAVPYVFSNEEIQTLNALAELAGAAIEKARLYGRVLDAEEQLRRNEKLSALGLIAAEVAHEIRNPLTVMKLLYHSLDLRFPPGDPRDRDARILGEKMEQLNRIVERILDLARPPEPERAPVDLNALVEELGLLVRHKLSQRKIEWRCRLLPDLPRIQGAAAPLEQALLNLALNAAEAMPDGGALEIRTRVAPGRGPRRVQLEVRDNGRGMSEAQRRSASASLLASGKPGGTGLGLHLVRRVVEAHQGRLQIRSSPGRGTSIILSFPV